jgi:hypothetical protein
VIERELCGPPGLRADKYGMSPACDTPAALKIINGLSPSEMHEILIRLSVCSPRELERALFAISDRRAAVTR